MISFEQPRLWFPVFSSSLPARASWEMDFLGRWVVFPGLAPTQGLSAPWTMARGGTLCAGENRPEAPGEVLGELLQLKRPH